ncbi:MAG TPA: hypothetical protein VFP89_10155 [Propionibacteriaceae bacterium]|nr:hypothetical protein [Propionibacteriaceae bacterium]
MTPVRLTRDLVAAGFTHNEIARQVRSGTLAHLRRGAYLRGEGVDLTPSLRHLRLIEATIPQTAPGSVVSHLSAAVMHGLPVLGGDLGRVRMTRAASGGRSRGNIHLYTAALRAEEVVVIGGIPTTSLARTVVDIGRTVGFDGAVVVGDAARRTGLAVADLMDGLVAAAGRPGVARARRVCAFLDDRSESPGESLSRVLLHDGGLPPSSLQHRVLDPSGRLIGRADFCWEEQRTLGEFDGRVKYGRLLKPGETAQDVIYREKLREDAMRDLGWQVVRWTWADLSQPAGILDRLTRAFARA